MKGVDWCFEEDNRGRIGGREKKNQVIMGSISVSWVCSSRAVPSASLSLLAGSKRRSLASLNMRNNPTSPALLHCSFTPTVSLSFPSSFSGNPFFSSFVFHEVPNCCLIMFVWLFWFFLLVPCSNSYVGDFRWFGLKWICFFINWFIFNLFLNFVDY